MSNQNFLFYKIQSNNFNLDHPDIRTLIKKKGDVDWPNQAILNSVLNKARKVVLLFHKS